MIATGGIFTYLSQSALSDTARRFNSSKENAGKTYAYVGAATEDSVGFRRIGRTTWS